MAKRVMVTNELVKRGIEAAHAYTDFGVEELTRVNQKLILG